MRLSGFSLIELLVVVGIVALINAIMLPNFTVVTSMAKNVSSKSNVRNMMVAIEQSYFIHQVYPDAGSISDLIDQLNASNIIQTAPINPFTGAPYSSIDTSGKLVYRRMNDNAYELALFGMNNDDVIFEYP